MKKLRIKRRLIRKILFFACLFTMIISMTSVAYAKKNDYSVTVSMPDNEGSSITSVIQILIVLI